MGVAPNILIRRREMAKMIFNRDLALAAEIGANAVRYVSDHYSMGRERQDVI